MVTYRKIMGVNHAHGMRKKDGKDYDFYVINYGIQENENSDRVGITCGQQIVDKDLVEQVLNTYKVDLKGLLNRDYFVYLDDLHNQVEMRIK